MLHARNGGARTATRVGHQGYPSPYFRAALAAAFASCL
ncbi:hypothetical protein SGPA1_50096 [Streptomyces misionensis JCM 4497]